MKKIKIIWGDEIYLIPVFATDYNDLSIGSQARREMYRLQCAITEAVGGTWIRDRVTP